MEYNVAGRIIKLALVVLLITNCKGSGTDNSTRDEVSYTVSANSNAEGIISPMSLVIKQGQSADFIITASEGFGIKSVESDCGDESDITQLGNMYTLPEITKACTINAVFNQLPVVNAGQDFAVLENTTGVILTGAATDPDSTAPVTVLWTVNKPSLVTATTSNDELVAGFIAPDNAEGTPITLTFTLSVTDDDGMNSSDEVNVSVNPQLPIADANTPQSVSVGSLIVLDGSGSTNPKPDENFSYRWQQSNNDISGVVIVLENANSAQASFTMPELSEQQTLVLELEVEDYRGLTDMVTLNIVLVAPLKNVLNDTGVVLCSDSSTNLLSCNDPSITDSFTSGRNYMGQDGQYGRDLNNNDSVDGPHGFSFSKLDAEGRVMTDQSLSYSVSPWRCVKDNVTGLIWETKTLSGIQSTDNTYYWYSENMSGNGGEVGRADDGSGVTCANAGQCDTAKYIATINGVGLCGFTSNWRLPTREELRSIVDYSTQNSAPPIDFFPHASSDSGRNWSSNVRAQDVEYAWYGGAGVHKKRERGHIRLVRGGQ